MPQPVAPLRLMSGSYPGDWGDFLVAYEQGDKHNLRERVQGLIRDKKNHRQYETSLPLSPCMANAIELMDIALGNDDPELLDAVASCYPGVLQERSVEEISPSSTTGLCSLTSSHAMEMPIRATWLELASFRLSIQCTTRLLALDALSAQPEERMGWPAGLAMWAYAESRIWKPVCRMLDILQALHRNGANLNLPDPWGRLPLCLLSRAGPPAQAIKVCAALMEMGASPSGPADEDGVIRNDRPFRNCPALENIRQGNLPAASHFLATQPGAVVAARSDGGNTALHVVAMGCLRAVEPSRNIVLLARELLDEGSDPDAENDEGITPLEVAVGQDNLLEFGKELHRRGAMLDRGPTHWPLLFTACGCPDPSAGKPSAHPSMAWVKWLISKGCDPNDRVLGRSVVHHIMQAQPRISMPLPNKRPKPCQPGVLGEVIAAGWRPLASDSGSIEDMVMMNNPGPSLDSEKGWTRLEHRARAGFLVECAIEKGWLEDPLLPAPSPEFAAFMGSRWSRRLLERGTTDAETGDGDQRRF